MCMCIEFVFQVLEQKHAHVLGHTPSTAGTFRKIFQKNSGKTPETLSGMVRGFSRFVPFLFLGLLRAPTRNSPERVRDTIWAFPEKSGKPPGLASLNRNRANFRNKRTHTIPTGKDTCALSEIPPVLLGIP